MEDSMSNIETEKEIAEAPKDAVSLDVQATNTRFIGAGQRRRIVKQLVVNANIKASVELGIVSISDRDNDVMLTVRIEDMTAILAAVYGKAKEEEECTKTETKEASETAPDADRE